MFGEIKFEKFSEQPKECLIKKLDGVYDFFNSEKLAYDEVFLKNVKDVIGKIEKLKPEQIAADSHMAHILGQLYMGFGFAGRIKNIPEKKKMEEVPDKDMRRKYRENFLQMKNSLKKYVELCLSEEDFFNAEISFRGGYWEGKMDKNERADIAELNASQFVENSYRHFREKKEYREAA